MKADLAVLRSQEIQWREEVQRLGREMEQVRSYMYTCMANHPGMYMYITLLCSTCPIYVTSIQYIVVDDLTLYI